jgi:hypothetical protein
VLENVDAAADRRLVLLSENLLYMLGPGTIDGSVDPRIWEKQQNASISPVNHDYVVHERPVDPHDAAVLVEQVLDRRDVAVPG